MTHATLIPAYGRDYKSKAAVVADWESGKDFILSGYVGTAYFNKESARDAGIQTVNIRYSNLRKACVLECK